MFAYYLLLIVNHSPLRWRNQIRDFVFSSFSQSISHLPVYCEWLNAKQYFYDPNDTVFVRKKLANIKTEKLPSAKIAVHFHVYYPDLVTETLDYFTQFPAPFDLLISTTTAEDLEYCLNVFRGCPNIQNIIGKVVKNQGRDLAPLLCDFASTLRQYDYFAHIHTKKSLGVNAIGTLWRKYLFQALLCRSNVEKILTLLKSHSIVYPKTFHYISYEDCIWGMSYAKACELTATMGITKLTDGFIHFPVGCMFWAQVKSFRPLFDLNLSTNDFEVELKQTNGTLAHCIERLLATVPTQCAGPAAIIE